MRHSEILERLYEVSTPAYDGAFDPVILEQYFASLSRVFTVERSVIGKTVIGLSPGRSGSTSLTGIMRSIPGCVATHENPPSFFNDGQSVRCQFHIARFRFFCNYVPLVFDISPHWISYADRIAVEFPDSQFIHLVRPTDEIVKSFEKMQLLLHERTPRQYVEDHYRKVIEFGERVGDRMMTIQLADLDAEEMQDRLFAFLGVRGRHTVLHHNRDRRLEGSMYWL